MKIGGQMSNNELKKYYENLKAYYEKEAKKKQSLEEGKISKKINTFFEKKLDNKKEENIEFVNNLEYSNFPTFYIVLNDNLNYRTLMQIPSRKSYNIISDNKTINNKKILKYTGSLFYSENNLNYVIGESCKELINGNDMILSIDKIYELDSNFIEIAKITHCPVISVYIKNYDNVNYINTSDILYFKFYDKNEDAVNVIKEEFDDLSFETYEKIYKKGLSRQR